MHDSMVAEGNAPPPRNITKRERSDGLNRGRGREREREREMVRLRGKGGEPTDIKGWNRHGRCFIIC